jgi:hypothetical protein
MFLFFFITCYWHKCIMLYALCVVVLHWLKQIAPKVLHNKIFEFERQSNTTWIVITTQKQLLRLWYEWSNFLIRILKIGNVKSYIKTMGGGALWRKEEFWHCNLMINSVWCRKNVDQGEKTGKFKSQTVNGNLYGLITVMYTEVYTCRYSWPRYYK